MPWYLGPEIQQEVNRDTEGSYAKNSRLKGNDRKMLGLGGYNMGAQ
jgi:hypothetical protein